MTREEEIKKAKNRLFPIPENGRCLESSCFASGFEKGAKWADEHPQSPWHKIERDKDGFVTDKCFDEIAKNFPVTIVEKITNMLSGISSLFYYTIEDIDICKSEIHNDTNFIAWMPIPKFKEEK